MIATANELIAAWDSENLLTSTDDPQETLNLYNDSFPGQENVTLENIREYLESL